MLFLFVLAGVLAFPVRGNAQVMLGIAADYGMIASTAITNVGLSVVNGNVGITPNDRTSITGFPPGVVTGTIEAANAQAMAARADALAAYTAAAASVATTDLTGQDLGGRVLTSGVYSFSSSAGLTGTVTMDGQGDPDSIFIIKTGSTLITASAASVVLVNGARPCNVYFQVGSSATLGSGTTLRGFVLARTSITANSGAVVDGGLFALDAAITLISNTITAPGNCSGFTPSSTLSSVSSTTIQSGSSGAVSANNLPTSSVPSVRETGTSLSQTTLIISTITREASISDQGKSTKTKKDKKSTKTPSNCACRGGGPIKTCVCQGSDKEETEEDE